MLNSSPWGRLFMITSVGTVPAVATCCHCAGLL